MSFSGSPSSQGRKWRCETGRNSRNFFGRLTRTGRVTSGMIYDCGGSKGSSALSETTRSLRAWANGDPARPGLLTPRVSTGSNRSPRGCAQNIHARNADQGAALENDHHQVRRRNRHKAGTPLLDDARTRVCIGNRKILWQTVWLVADTAEYAKCAGSVHTLNMLGVFLRTD